MYYGLYQIVLWLVFILIPQATSELPQGKDGHVVADSLSHSIVDLQHCVATRHLVPDVGVVDVDLVIRSVSPLVTTHLDIMDGHCTALGQDASGDLPWGHLDISPVSTPVQP